MLVLGPSLEKNIFKSIPLITSVELDLTGAGHTWTWNLQLIFLYLGSTSKNFGQMLLLESSTQHLLEAKPVLSIYLRSYYNLTFLYIVSFI